MTAQLIELPRQPTRPIVQIMPRTRRRILRAVVATPPFELPKTRLYPGWICFLLWAALMIGCAAFWYGAWTLLRHLLAGN